MFCPTPNHSASSCSIGLNMVFCPTLNPLWDKIQPCRMWTPGLKSLTH